MSDSGKDDAPRVLTIDAKPPFSFGLDAEGRLVIQFSLQGLTASLVIPAVEIGILRQGLDQSQGIRDTLSAKKPPQGAH